MLHPNTTQGNGSNLLKSLCSKSRYSYEPSCSTPYIVASRQAGLIALRFADTRPQSTFLNMVPTHRTGRIRWLLVGWMFAISAIAYLDRVNISIAGSSLQKEFDLDNIRLGWVFSSFVFGYGLFQAPGGRLADRFGPRKILLLATVWWAVFTVLVALPPAGHARSSPVAAGPSFSSWRRRGDGLPCIESYGCRLDPYSGTRYRQRHHLRRSWGGSGRHPALITFILLNYGWRASFWICALLGLIAGFIWYLIARDRPEEHPWVRPPELEHIRSGLPARSAATPRALSWGAIFRSRNVWALTLSYSTFGYVAYIFFTWFFIYLNKVRGLDLKASAFFGMLPFIAMATFSTAGGFVSDGLTRRFGKRIGRCGVAGVCMAVAAAFLVVGMYAESARLASVVLAGGAGFLYFSISSFWSITADIAGSSAGSVSGVMNMGNQLAGTLTASVTPLLARDFGWSSPFLVAAAVCAVGASVWLLVDPDRAIEPNSRMIRPLQNFSSSADRNRNLSYFSAVQQYCSLLPAFADLAQCAPGS